MFFIAALSIITNYIAIMEESGIFKNLKAELDSIMDRDPAARTRLEVFLLYSEFRVVRFYRWADWLYRHDMKLITRYIFQWARHKAGVEIHPAAKIRKELFIDHDMGVVIDETVEVSDYCTLYQGVALGGTSKDQNKHHPTLSNNVVVDSGAKVLGPSKAGDNVRVAADTVVLNEVPPGAAAVGVPARIMRIDGEKSYELGQINVSNPVEQKMVDLQNVYTALGIQVEILMDRLESYQKDRTNEREP